MDWSKTKSIFIIAFLLLNVFLAFQLKEKNSANEISLITEAPIQEILKEMNVEIDGVIVDDEHEGSHIVGRKLPVEQFKLTYTTSQEIEEVDETTLFSTLNEPFALNKERLEADLKLFMVAYVPQESQYTFHRFDEEKNVIYMMQLYDGKMMYSFEDAPLVLHLDKDDRIVSYEQSLFEVDEAGEAQEFLQALKAIEILLNEKVIVANDTISSVDLRYYSFFKPEGAVQVFAPMWQIQINETDYLVNAIDGSIVLDSE